MGGRPGTLLPCVGSGDECELKSLQSFWRKPFGNRTPRTGVVLTNFPCWETKVFVRLEGFAECDVKVALGRDSVALPVVPR